MLSRYVNQIGSTQPREQEVFHNKYSKQKPDFGQTKCRDHKITTQIILKPPLPVQTEVDQISLKECINIPIETDSTVFSSIFNFVTIRSEFHIFRVAIIHFLCTTYERLFVRTISNVCTINAPWDPMNPNHPTLRLLEPKHCLLE